MARKINDDSHEVSERAREAGSDLRLYVGAGDGNRTRTISLGIGQITADEAAEQPTSETRSTPDCPLLTVANCTLIARRSSAFQAWHIPSRGEICERPALLSIANASRRLPPLLSAVRAWPARPANQIPAARHAGRSWLGRERLPATSRAVGGKPERAAVPGAGQPRKLGQIGIVRNSPART